MSHNYGVTAAKAFLMHARQTSGSPHKLVHQQPGGRLRTWYQANEKVDLRRKHPEKLMGRTTRMALLLVLILLETACGPQGQVQRVIHPPLLLSARDARNHSGKNAAPSPRTRQGLPSQCRLEVRVKDTFCISCDEGGADIERCYVFRGTFDEAKNCVHSAEHIKCLNVTPPFALTIALKGSLEKTLMENTRIWQESLRSIAKPQLSMDLQMSLEEGLEHTGQLVQMLVQARKETNWIDQNFPQLAPPVKKALHELQQQKEAGQLKLLQILQVSRMILESSGTPASLLSFWEALSVDGLEEPGE
jgi:hypothetical protein